MSSFTINSCLKLSPQLAQVSDTPRLDIELLLCHILKKTRTWIFTWPDSVLNESQVKEFENYFARRLAGEPIAHIIGVREFWSLPLSVDNSTLIPRPDTELLVETALELFAHDLPNIHRDVLDLGTGTGAIILALAHEKNHWHCVGVDKEQAAVDLAEKNRVSLQLANVHILKSNWFDNISTEKLFDLIVSNPPYIDSNDPHLNQGDVRFEPRSALVADNKGLADIEVICKQSNIFLKTDGWLLVEHGYNQGEDVRRVFEVNDYIDIKTLRDMGDNERVTLGRKSSMEINL
jgi:release factor glutamine methyltransferase